MPALFARHGHRLFPDEIVTDLSGSGRGRPPVPAVRVATGGGVPGAGRQVEAVPAAGACRLRGGPRSVYGQ